jgi:hypothetical protein
MRALAVSAVLGICTVFASVGFAQGSASTRGGTAAVVGPTRAQLRSFVCGRALDPPARALSVTAVMRPVAGTQHMQINFVLLEKVGGGAWSSVAGPHFGVWISPQNQPTLGQRPGDVWKVPFPVADLAAPASYRLEVSFRWLGQHGVVLAAVTRLTRGCWQPELRADLAVASIGIVPRQTPVGTDQFNAVVRNTGATGTGPFDVRLSYTHGQQPVIKDRKVVRLRAFSATSLVFGGLACDPGSEVTITADPLHVVDVSSRAAASLTVSCPTPQTSSPAAVG